MPDNLPKDPLKPLCYFKLGPESPSLAPRPPWSALPKPGRALQGNG